MKQLIRFCHGLIALPYPTSKESAEDTGFYPTSALPNRKEVIEHGPKKSPRPLTLRCIDSLLALAVGTAFAQPVSIDAKTLKKLQETIDQQQLLMQKQTQELKSQSEMLNALQKQVNDLNNKTSEAQTQAVQAKSKADMAVDTANKATETAQATAQREVTSGQDRVKLAVSGQVNRAVNIADDGKNTAAYYVDNDASNSRVRLSAPPR